MTHVWNCQVIISFVLITLPIIKGGICVYYKSTLPLRMLNISNLDECINFEISIANKICRFSHLYRSPSQEQDEFQEFKSNLAINLDALSANNTFLTVMIGDFNAKSSNWYLNDVTSFEGSQIEFLASQFAMSQVINEPTHILDNSKSCIDLIFIWQPNMRWTMEFIFRYVLIVTIK